MKKVIQKIFILSMLCTVLTACDSWFDVESSSIMTEDQVFGNADGVTSALSSLYETLPDDQEFNVDIMNQWDESIGVNINTTVDYGDDYRRYYDYEFLYQINTFLANLESQKSSLPAEKYTYFQAEGRFMRAYVYYVLARNMGGVPLITEKTDYNEDEDFTTYRTPRSKEIEVYEFIASELDAIKNDLDVRANGVPVKNRASKGAALALKCRAMLYAGSIAKYTQDSNLRLPGGETGIDASKANNFFDKAVEAAQELQAMNVYSLYKGSSWNTDKAGNFAEIFLKKNADNPEAIFVKDYDGVNKGNLFTEKTIPHSQRAVGEGAAVSPTLNLVEAYELVEEGTASPLRTVNGAEVVEEVSQTESKLDYIIYNHPEDIFSGRDPRLAGSILTPGSKFRGSDMQLWAGIAVWKDGKYEFKYANKVDDKEEYEGLQMTGLDGPHAASNVSNTGFLLRKYVDTKSGSEMAGQSDVAFIRFRYAEVLLNASEAAFEMGDPEGIALGFLNEVRNRAGVKPLTTISSIDVIRHERQVELAFEDHRFNDLKRWRTGTRIFDGNANTTTAVVYGLWPYKILRPGHASDGKWLFRRVKANKRQNALKFNNNNYYASFSADVLSKNPLLVKNPYQN